MARAEAWALERGARTITLDTYATSPLSNPFYQSLGYRITSVTYERTLETTERSE
jgi:GNAT superfamily N-acetyltransferase